MNLSDQESLHHLNDGRWCRDYLDRNFMQVVLGTQILQPDFKGAIAVENNYAILMSSS